MPNRILAMAGASHSGPTAMLNVLSLKRQTDRIEELETKVLSLSAPKQPEPTPIPAPAPTPSPEQISAQLAALEAKVADLTAQRDELAKRVSDLEKKMKA
jgi:hypothetical protein